MLNSNTNTNDNSSNSDNDSNDHNLAPNPPVLRQANKQPEVEDVAADISTSPCDNMLFVRSFKA